MLSMSRGLSALTVYILPVILHFLHFQSATVLLALHSNLASKLAGKFWQHLHDLLVKLLHYACHVQEPILLRLKSCLCLLYCCFCPLLKLLHVRYIAGTFGSESLI